jgi:hypothetical protein
MDGVSKPVKIIGLYSQCSGEIRSGHLLNMSEERRRLKKISFYSMMRSKFGKLAKKKCYLEFLTLFSLTILVYLTLE